MFSLDFSSPAGFVRYNSAHPIMPTTPLLSVHNWAAFWTVVCLGLIQVTITYCGSHLAIESLPEHIMLGRRRTYRKIFAVLLATLIVLTLVLAKLNDSNQHRAEIVIEQERAKQEALRVQLDETFRAVTASQGQLQRLKEAIDTHPPSAERNAMLDSINHVQGSLENQTNSMRRFPH